VKFTIAGASSGSAGGREMLDGRRALDRRKGATRTGGVAWEERRMARGGSGRSVWWRLLWPYLTDDGSMGDGGWLVCFD